jgi:DNA-binding NtrC family response regulator
VPSVSGLGERVRSLFHREPKEVVPRTILIVDANASERQSTARLVRALGYEPFETAGLAEAVAHLEEHDPECVLLGFDLADGNGLDALARIRELDADLAVIMLAPNVWDTRAAEAMRHGAVAYLARPFGADDLRELLGRR